MKDMGHDDESSNPRLCSEVAGSVTRNIVSLFREPDAGNLPVRFDEREQETGPGQTGLRRAQRKPNPTATGRLQLLRLFSTLLLFHSWIGFHAQDYVLEKRVKKRSNCTGV